MTHRDSRSLPECPWVSHYGRPHSPLTIDIQYLSSYNAKVEYFDWDEEKNQQLKEERDISFEEVLIAIADNQILNIIEHPNKKKYPNQKIFIVNINEYAYLVPFIEDEEKIFLKTVIPSRKATKKYIIEKRRNV